MGITSKSSRRRFLPPLRPVPFRFDLFTVWSPKTIQAGAAGGRSLTRKCSALQRSRRASAGPLGSGAPAHRAREIRT